MGKIILSAAFALFLFGGALACLRFGWRIGKRRFQTEGEVGQSGLGAIEGAIFGLMGLLIAFTFTGAATRFHERRDLSTSRLMASRQHPPLAVFLMLGLLVLLSSLMAGIGMAKAEKQSPLHLFGFAAIMSLSFYLILDIEYPRLGLVRIDSFDQALVELRASMN
ncbi:MAG: hypothetical protein JW829_13710 [Pirellulales bacterium]|nr:hypothetical protein [Pirellulales bacterium]